MTPHTPERDPLVGHSVPQDTMLAIVADDEPAVRRLVGEALGREGFRVLEAADGHRVIDLLEAQDVDLLVSDIRMPGPTGIDVVGMARELSPRTSCIVITGDASLETARSAAQSGALDYLPKPFTQRDLIDAVNSALSRKSKEKARARERELADLSRLSEDVLSVDDPWQMLRVTLTTALLQTESDAGCLATLCDGSPLPFTIGPAGLQEAMAAHGVDCLMELVAGSHHPTLLTRNSGPHPLSGVMSIIDGQSGRLIDGLAEVLVFPLRDGGRVLGAISVGRLECDASYTKGDYQVMSVLAAQCGLLLKNADLVESLQRAYLGTVQTMARVMEARDNYTHGHSRRVADLCRRIGQGLDISPEEGELLQLAAGLHDIGKIAVPDGILNKPGALTDEEWASIRQHPVVGAEVLAPAAFLTGARPLVLHHHERYDGMGYPQGVDHTALSELAHIIIIADAFDAMTSTRPYRSALTVEEALRELEAGCATQFDPAVAQAAVELIAGSGSKAQ